MSEDPIIHIARNGENLGAWPASQIRQMVVAQQLLITDHYYEDESKTWLTLVPTPKRRALLFDWAGEDDRLWFYIKDGFIRGPREAEEIDALYEAEHLDNSTLVCFLGAAEWVSYGSLLEDEESGGDEESDGGHFDAAADLLKQGNLTASALNFGMGMLPTIFSGRKLLSGKGSAPESLQSPSPDPESKGDETAKG